jgi:hypothetical protein
MNLSDIRIFYPTATEYTLFSVVLETFSKIGHILGHKVNLNQYKIEITSYILSAHNGTKLEVNKGNYKKYTNM